MKFNALKNIPKKSMELVSEKLLYSCQIALAALESENEIKFMAKGQFRMGPMKSNVHIQSEFIKRGQDVLFKSYRVNVDRLGYFENYELDGNAINYSNSKGQSVRIDINNKLFQDPLSFLFQAVNEGKSFAGKAEIPLLIGQRIEKISSEKIEGLLSLIKKSKILATIKEEVDRWIIEIPKLRLKLSLMFKQQKN